MTAGAAPGAGAAHGFRYPAADELLAAASRATGLANFGQPDFREGLDVLLDSLRRDARLTDDGAGQAVAMISRRLANRLLIEEWYRTHPEIAEQPIDRPISITGLVRTGTTALGNIMSQDDQFRCLRRWEAAEPCPPPVLAEEATDPRRLASQQLIAARKQHDPDHAAKHIYEVDTTVEDTEVLGLQFRAQQYTLPVFGYHRWWRDTDMRSTYAYHRRVALLLQSRRPPNRWLFKAPHHKFHLEAVVSAYPDLRFIMTHRDPAKVVPSYCSLVMSIFPPGEIDPAQLGREVCEHLRIGMERAIAARRRIGEDRFIDVHHREFRRDPLGTLGRIYDVLGLELRPEARRAMEEWSAGNAVGAQGTHRYTAEQFGLTDDQIRSDYDFYLRAFDIAREG